MLKCYIYMMKPWHQNMAMGVAYQSSSYDSTKRILTMSRSDATIYERVRRQTIVIECIYLIDSTIVKQKRSLPYGCMSWSMSILRSRRSKWGMVCNQVYKSWYGLITIRRQLHSWILNDTKR
eukprot:815633_1